jgi:Leucine-rich repeat (LRR) protein
LLRLLPQEIVSLDASDNGVRWWELPQPTTVFSGLQKLVLANNKMESFTVGGSLPNLTYLDLSYNELTHIDLSLCKKLSVLLARKNFLAKVVFSVESSCTEQIDISYNSLKDISHILERMTGTLQDFNAEGNLLEKIPALCFQNTPNIKRLNLSKNFVEKISKTALATLHQIQFMNLSNNLLQNIPQGVLDVKTLEKMLLFRCPLEKSVAEYIQGRVDLQHKVIL